MGPRAGEDCPGTVDWDDHWREREANADEREATRESGARFADRFDRFLVGDFPAPFASVGCGLAPALFPLAERHPRSVFHGVDAAAPVVAEDREHAAERGVENLSFDVGGLPELAGVEREYGCVFCYATLHYVADSERALTVLYDHVAPGGTLVVHYSNRNTRRAYPGATRTSGSSWCGRGRT